MAIVRALPLLVLLPAASALLLAQTSRYEGKEIVTIQFDPKEQPLEASELFEILPLKKGQPLRMRDVRAAIERLYATGRYADIQVDAESYNSGVIIRFLTKNSWFIGNVEITGNLSIPPNRGQLENATRLELGEPYSPQRLDEAVAGARQLLAGNGLYHATVKPYSTYDEHYQQIHLTIDVNSGPRARYAPPQVSGETKMPLEKLLSATGWRRWIIHTWKPVKQARTRQGIDGILKRYQKDMRLEARVRIGLLDYNKETNRVTPHLEIDAGPKIQVQTVGAKLSQSKLRRYIPIFEEHSVDQDLLVEGAGNLRNYFQSQGFFEAQVEFKQQRVTNDKASIDYLVNTGKRHRMVHLEISGNKYFRTEAIRERMFLEPASFLQFRHGRYSASLLAQDKDSIVNLYRSNGFRDAAVTERTEDDYRGKSGDIAVFLTIAEGPQYFVNSLEVEGIERLDKTRILGMLSCVQGQPFSEFNVAVDRDTILARYFENGFPNATFEWSFKASADPHRIDLRFTIKEGGQEFVRQVITSGLSTTRDRLVNRNLRLNPGDPLSPVAMTETQHRLYDLGVFARVDMAIQNPGGDTNRKYVLYEMEEARRYSIAAGLGAEVAKIGGCQTCLDAPAGQAGFSPRVSLDLTRMNLWGLGHSISLRTRASTLDSRALLNYSAPRFRNQDGLTLSFTGLYEDSRDVRTFTSKRQEGSVQIQQRYSKDITMFYRYTYRRVTVDQGTLKISPFLIPLLSQPVRVGILSWNMVQDRRDDPLDPHRGVYTTVDLGLAEHFLGSRINFLRFLGRNATYHPIARNLTLARSTSFGNIYAFRFSGDPLLAIPLAERFFAGGNSSHRGFPENQAGPRDLVTGFPLGGTSLLFNQTELRFPLVGENIGGVLFHDVGNVYSSVRNISFRVKQHGLNDFDYMVHAVGFGLRYRTPVGPVRVDLAYSINPPNFFGFKGTPSELLNAGVNPCASAPGVPSRCVAQNVSHFQFFFSIGQTF